MKKFLLGLVAGLLLAALTIAVLFLTLLSLRERPPSIPEGSTLVLNLGGNIPERPPISIPIPLLGTKTALTVREIWDLLRKAAVDERIQAVVIFPQGVSAGWGKLQEIRDSLLKYRESGKLLVAFLRTAGGRDYYLATAADHIYMMREDHLDVKGLRAELVYYRGILDKLGVQVEVEYAGRYKDGADMLTRTSMRSETREVLNSILDLLYGHLLEVISASRGMSVEQTRIVLDEGPFLASQAVDKNLVDGLMFEDEMFGQLGERLGQKKIRKVPYSDYLQVPAASLGLASGPRIAFLVGEGSIVAGNGQDGLGEEGVLLSGSFIRTVRAVANDDRIKGVILRINSGGGDAIASGEIMREIQLLSARKPIVISMSDMAASGGYYIAMTGDPIVAYPHTQTGSIGVFYGKLNLRGLYDKLGIQKEYLTRGLFAGIDSDYVPLSEPARAKLREGVEYVYEDFLNRVAQGRNQERESIEPLAEGRVWLGVQAHENGLVDELGGLDRAIEIVKERAGIPPEDSIRLIPYPPKRSFMHYLLNLREQPVIENQLRKLLNGVDVRLLTHGGILKLMPYTIDVR